VTRRASDSIVRSEKLERGLTRRALLQAGATVLLGGLLGRAGSFQRGISAQGWALDGPLRIGTIIPGTSGARTIDAALFDLAGDAARFGTLLAETEFNAQVAAPDMSFDVLLANTPSAEAAHRAAERFIAVEDVSFLIGGLGYGQTDVLSKVAEANRVPFLNIGDSSDTLRQRCSQYTFHIEASQAMYLDAMVMWHAQQGYRRWFVLHEMGNGDATAARARLAVEKHGLGGEVVGTAAVIQEQPLYALEARAIEESNADVVLIAVPIRDEIPVRIQLSSLARPVAIAALPTAVTQTRDFIAASRERAPTDAVDYRIMLWESTLQTHGADTLVQRYTSRTGQAMDPSAWAAYQAVGIAVEAVMALGTTDPEQLVAYLADDVTFTSAKGPGISFRPWDHQLRQPLYVAEVDPQAPWGDAVSRRIAVARLAETLPNEQIELGRVREVLDTLGDGPDGGAC
jgi:branched-chain amino acid transport system substrate-binding protein